MTSLQVFVIGGGPAGMTVARLLKRRQPAWKIVVFERLAPEFTFGYGVGLGSAIGRLAAADTELATGIEQIGHPLAEWTIERDTERSTANNHAVGVSRTRLLQLLERCASEAGVEIRRGADVLAEDLGPADVVIGADGVGSDTRTSHTDELGVTTSVGDLAYLWCGAPLALDGMTLSIRSTAAGPLAAHVMPYGPAATTFQIDGPRHVVTAIGDGVLEQLESTFADLLDGRHLEAKRAEWSYFTTVSCERWATGNTVLVGDAAHTAHYTVGSGTTLAVDDAVALAEALSGEASISAAFAAYQKAREHHVERIQARAARSERWWSTLEVRATLPLPQLMLSYLTRTGALTLDAVAEHNAPVVAGCLRGGDTLPADLADHVLAEPERRYTHNHNRSDLPTVVVDGDLDAAVTAALHAGRTSKQVRLAGPDDRDALLDRLEVAELVRAGGDVATVVQGSASTRSDLALGVLSDRTDLVEVT